jgi:hypothetical protein
MRRRNRRTTLCAAIAAGVVAGTATVTAAETAIRREPSDHTFIAGAHLPPLLTASGEPVRLRYAILCGDDATLADGDPCDGGGDVYVRAGHAGSFTRLTLLRGADSREGRYFADVPADIAASPTGFSYYAVLRDDRTGATTMLPAAGAAAPQDSYPIGAAVSVALGAHRFAATQPATKRVVEARWGTAVGELGLTGGDTAARIGPSSFDVSADGTVTVLDEVNGRVVRWHRGVASATPVDVPPALDDMAVAPDGSVFVADGTRAAGETPLLRTFGPDGRLRATTHLPERTWSQLRMSPDGPVVQEHPSEQWMPPSRAAGGKSGRRLADGSRLVVLRVGADEIRVARIVNGAVHASWRVRSATPLGEVQLAEPMGNRLLLVAKVYTEADDEYDVLVLDADGVARRFSISSAAWAETAPLARFRLVGTTLYRFGSDAAGAFVDSYDLGGVR